MASPTPMMQRAVLPVFDPGDGPAMHATGAPKPMPKPNPTMTPQAPQSPV